MSLLSRFLAINPMEDRYYQGGSTVLWAEAGQAVTKEAAMKIATVNRAVNVMAAGVAVLPLDVFDPLERGKEVAKGAPERRLLKRRPNRLQSSYRWRHHMVGHLLLGGNYYAQKVRASARSPIEQLFPMDPARVRVLELTTTGEPRYEYTRKDGSRRQLAAPEVLHIRGFSLDGVMGISVLDAMRETVGQAIASRQSRSNFIRNALRPSVVIKHPKPLSEKAEANILDGYKRAYAGPTNHGGAMVVAEGADITAFGVSGKDAQWVESDLFNVEEFLRFIGVPGVLVGHNDKTATYASAEAFFQSFVTHSLWPVTANIEQELTLSLFDDEGDSERHAEFNLNAMLRADSAARAQFYRAMVEMGILTRNEVRELENRNPLPGLDDPLTPMNMGRPMEPGSPPPSRPGPKRPPEPPDDDEDDEDEKDARQALARAEEIVHEAAARVLRKETVAVLGAEGKKGAAERFAKDNDGWRAWVTDFYARHVDLVAGALRVPLAVAERYCNTQRDYLLAGGVAAIGGWEATRVPHLVEVALKRKPTGIPAAVTVHSHVHVDGTVVKNEIPQAAAPTVKVDVHNEVKTPTVVVQPAPVHVQAAAPPPPPPKVQEVRIVGKPAEVVTVEKRDRMGRIERARHEPQEK
jgi:HK97 family phage portal protein